MCHNHSVFGLVLMGNLCKIKTLQRYTFICNRQNAAEIVIHCRHKNKKGATLMPHLFPLSFISHFAPMPFGNPPP